MPRNAKQDMVRTERKAAGKQKMANGLDGVCLRDMRDAHKDGKDGKSHETCAQLKADHPPS